MEKDVFKYLNTKLKEEDIHLNLICVGGFVLNYYNLRTTLDIDAFYKRNDKIDKIIYEVGEKFNLNTKTENWLNNDVARLNKIPPEKYTKILYNFSNLKVYITDLVYILGMKLQSRRQIDKNDISKIIEFLKLKDPLKLIKQLKSYGFSVESSTLLEAFENVYGVNWLEKFLKENTHKLH